MEEAIWLTAKGVLATLRYKSIMFDYLIVY